MHPIWYLRRPLGYFIKKRYNLEIFGSFPKPPFLLIANHTHNFDPLFISTFLKNPIYWIVAKGTFEKPILGPLFKFMNFIPKQKGEPDVSTIRKILKNLNENKIVGIFPEGSITWDGNFQDMPPGIDKLLNIVKTPIVAVKIMGGYLTKPRWANFERKGRIILNVQTFNDSSALDFIKHNEWEWQKVQKIKFKGKNLASGIERILWFCPKCYAFKSINSYGNKAICKNCNSSFTVDDFGYINSQTVEEILKAQVETLDKRFKEINTIKNVKIIIRDKKNKQITCI